MKAKRSILDIFRGGRRFINGARLSSFGGWTGAITTMPFADTVFLNCCELLTDLAHDVTWLFSGSQRSLEVAFDRFFKQYGKLVLNMLYRDGVVVIGHTQMGDGQSAAHEFHICQPREYARKEENGWIVCDSLVPGQEVYAMTSATFQSTGKSDRAMCSPFLEYLDNTLNASNTVSAHMGAFVVCSPKNVTSLPTGVVLDEDEKKEIEEQMSREYGACSKQSQVMVLPREMSWQVISLASLDLKVTDKVKMAAVAIADRLKVPANQIGIIDAMSSKSLANGTELREGDFNKYQSFERLLDQTFVQMARACGLQPGGMDIADGVAVASYYTIYNKPKQAAEPATAI